MQGGRRGGKGAAGAKGEGVGVLAPAPTWSGGFSSPMHPILTQLSHSQGQDRPLADADLLASAAYARALGRCGVLSTSEGEILADGLDIMRAELAAGRWQPDPAAEDIHSAIEGEISRRLGSLGERLHTGRSRNDQVATAFRLAVAAAVGDVMQAAHALQAVLVQRAAELQDVFLPAYTHLQRAQPIRLSHWLMSWFWPLERDRTRLAAARRQALVLPLGAGAVSGHPFGLDRAWLAAQLGFVAITENSLDTVGDRDFAIEAAFAASLVALHLSRLAEELVIYSTAEFAYVRWPDALASGSSLMPNKKNPDLAELVRGRSAAAIGDLVSLLTLIKGLPGSYQRDLQGDKPPIWRILADTRLSLQAMAVAMAQIEFDGARMAAALTDDILATEAADILVARGVPFRQAHHRIAACVAAARRQGVGLRQLGSVPGVELPSPLTAADLAGLEVVAAVERRSTAGGTARSAVVAQLQAARDCLARPLGL